MVFIEDIDHRLTHFSFSSFLPTNMYRAHTINVTNDQINVTNDFRKYEFTMANKKYVRPQEWDEYAHDLRNGHSMTKYLNPHVPLGPRHCSPKKIRADADYSLGRNNRERELKRHKSAPPPLSSIVLKPPDIEEDKRRNGPQRKSKSRA